MDILGSLNIEVKLGSKARLLVNMTESPVDVNTSMIYFTLPVDDDLLGFAIDFEPIPELYDGEKLEVS